MMASRKNNLTSKLRMAKQSTKDKIQNQLKKRWEVMKQQRLAFEIARLK